ncbi:MAG: para-aminobenzoate synthetase component 1 [Lentisphaeria bacterium]
MFLKQPHCHCHPIAYQPDSSAYFMRLKPLGKRVWLDSCKPHSQYGRFDILSGAPLIELLNPSLAEVEKHVDGLIDSETAAILKDLGLPFAGGAIGYINYEHNQYQNHIPSPKASTQSSVVGIFDWALVQDHLTQKAFLVFLPSCSSEQKQLIINTVCDNNFPCPGVFFVADFDSDLDHAHYIENIKKIKSYIADGDTYQINFSQRFSGIFKGEKDAAYLKLRVALPSPFSAYFELGDDVVMSLSPERFVKVENRQAITQPIKGTMPRGKTPENDYIQAQKLISSEKNRAENLMIVDLLRNDFSKACTPFSVKAPSLFSLESFANVHHLVSTVTGTLKPEITALQFFNHCFPGGSITGAPKLRAMEIIHELEDTPRNIYCGSIFYLDTNGNMDSSIAIRTLLISKNKIFCWGGGGIVADSNEEEEYEESLQKIRILIDTLCGESHN